MKQQSMTPDHHYARAPIKEAVMEIRLLVSGFTFSRLAPYETWANFQDEAKELWSKYRRLDPDAKISRIGLRYINQLDIPEPIRDVRDYVRTYPEVSSDLPQGLSYYRLQLQIPQPEIQATLLLTQATVQPPGPGIVQARST